MIKATRMSASSTAFKYIASATAYGVASALLAMPARAQSTAGGQGDSTIVEEIVVTAQKRDQNLLDVPVAVSAVSSDSLIQQNLVSLQDYATRIPGLSVTNQRTGSISIRGINAGGATSPTVAVTVDDVPFGSTSWAGNAVFPDLDPADIQQIEVLRGPQGTLYGASSLGGLIKYVTRNADPNRFSGRVEGTYNEAHYGSSGYALRGSVNVPVVDDKLGLRLSGFKRDEPKLVDRYDRTTGALLDNDAGSVELDGFRGAAFFQPIEQLTFNVSHLEQTRETANGGRTLIQPYPTNYRPVYDYFANDNAQSFGDTKLRLTQLRGELELAGLTLTSVSGWSRITNQLNSDNTRTFGFVFTGIPPAGIPPVYPGAPAGAQVRLTDASSTTKFSQEIRLASTGNGALDWMIGAFYTDEDSRLNQELYAAQASSERIGSVVIFPLPSTFEEQAVFGDLTYHVTDRFDVQIGGRYSENKQTYQANQTVVSTAVPLFGLTRVGAIARSSDDAFTWLVTPSFRLNDDIMAYARVATGYRPGGPNTASAPEPTFEPDTVTNYELGLKAQFLDRRLTLDASLFDIEWDDIQLGARTAAGISYFTNGGKARSRGTEASVQLSPGSGWLVTTNLTYNEAELRDDLPTLSTGAYILGKKGDPLPNAAKFSANLDIEKSWSLWNDFKFTVGGNYNHVGERDTAYRSSAAPIERQGKVRAPAYDVLDLRTSFGTDHWDATLFVRNVTDEHGIIDITDTDGTSTSMTAMFIQSRTIGLNLSYSF